ncbi:MAG: RHS repeat-associated core domain-containing protein [Bdellovibrio sp.]
MKTFSTYLALLFVLPTFSNADSSYLGRAPERGVIVTVTPDKTLAKSGEQVLFKGKITVVGRSNGEMHKIEKAKDSKGDKFEGLLEEFKKEGIEIFASFPSFANDISQSLILKSISKDEIEYSFQSSSINSSDANQFSLKVFNNSNDKEKLKKLSVIQSKIEKRVQLLAGIKLKFEQAKSSSEVLSVFQREIDKLKSIADKISSRINSDENLLAENVFSLQVDNLTAAISRSSSVMNKFRLFVEASPGNAIEGMKAAIKSSIIYISKNFDPKENGNNTEADTSDSDEEYLAEFLFNNNKFDSKKMAGSARAVNFSSQYDSPRLNAIDLNTVSVRLYHSEDGELKKIAHLDHKIPVQYDTVKPVWLSESIPNVDDRYVKNLRPVFLKVQDEFGRIDSSTFLAKITGSTVSTVSVNKDVSSILSTIKIGDGASYQWYGDIGSLEEGEYTLTANVNDLKGNQADTYSQTFRVDKTPPKIEIQLVQAPLTNKFNFEIPVFVTDESPTFTDVYVNDELFFSTGSKAFSANVTLNKEGVNIIKILSKDAAGNIGLDKSVEIIRDTTPPIIGFVYPKNNETVDGFAFQVSCETNEAVVAATLNGQSISLASEVRNFETSFSTDKDGDITIIVQATDKAGNTGTSSITVFAISRPLNQSLIGLYPDDINNKVVIRGAVGATRPFYDVTISWGFFQSKVVTADKSGGFMVSVDPNSEYKISVFDQKKSETVSYNFALGGENDFILSGTVRDTDNFPLVNAIVSIAGTTLSTRTDSNGVFKFTKSAFPTVRITGNQQLLIDGSSVSLSPQASPRKFSQTVVSITIGVKQSNILQTPIYMAPTYLDGSAIDVSVASGGTVTNDRAPGVVLNIPANAAQFPSGLTQEKISLTTIPAEYSTISPVPESMPKTVVALEPSGTTFIKPVDLQLPNVNEFPPQTEMVIMLMNSKTGKWEVGGAATVSPDGQSIVTKPDQGIRHFSLAYATIAGPNIRQIGAQDKPGADTFNGAFSTKIDLPSFKVLGNSYTPNLFYKSSWAKPTVAVTNFIDFPNKKAIVTPPKQYGSQLVKYSLDLSSCVYAFSGSSYCNSDQTAFYARVQYEASYSNVTSEVQPQKIIASFKTGGVKTVPYQFGGNIPHMANVSFSVDLKDNVDKKYFSSGLYPYQAHYDIFFKELIMGTATTKYWTSVTDAKTETSDQFNREYDRLFAQDLTDSIIVQNYQDSEAGRGWKIGGVQKILNPNGNKIVIEEADGGVSSYSIKNSIQTVLDANQYGIDISSGVALNSWPSIIGRGKNSIYFYNLNITENGISKTSLGANYPTQGTIVGYDYFLYKNEQLQTQNYCSTTSGGWTVISTPSQMIQLVDGRVIGIDSTRHAAFELSNGTGNRLMGVDKPVETISNFYRTQTDDHLNKINQYCSSIPGMNCSAFISATRVIDSKYPDCPYPSPKSIGILPSNYDFYGMALNSPMGIVSSPWPDIVVIADTGNHLVRWLNISTKKSGIIAGNWDTLDYGDGGPALSASLKHPQGLAYDRYGNLYISTESGYIRKVDTNGNISTVAGNPIDGKLANEVNALDALFNKPYGLVIDNDKNYLYVADTGHNRVVRIDLYSGIASTVAGTGSSTSSGDGLSALEAGIPAPTLLGLDADGNLLIAESGSNTIRRVIFQATQIGLLAFAPTSEDLSSLQKNSDGSWIRTYRNGSTIYFDKSGKQYAERDRSSRTTNFSYDAKGRLSKVALPTGQELIYSYNGEKLESITDPTGRKTSFLYDWSGDLSKVNYPDGSSKKYEYDSDGLLISEANQLGANTKYVYNAYSRLQKIVRADNTESVVNDSVSNNLLNYDSTQINQPKANINNVNVIQNANGSKTEIGKDFQGLFSTVVDAKGNKTVIKRNSKGQAILIFDPINNMTELNYNDYGDLVYTRDLSTGIVEQKVFDQWGNVIKEVDGNGNIYLKNYDTGTGLLSSQVTPDGTTVSYQYNSYGLVNTKTVSHGTNYLTTTFEYDGIGNLTKETQSNGKFTTYKYDNAGNIVERLNNISSSSQEKTQYVYDSFNRLVSVTSPNGEITTYSYSPVGDLTEIKDPSDGKISFQYDLTRRLTKKTDSLGNAYQYTYDNVGNVTKEIDPKGQQSIYTYDGLNNLIKAQLVDDEISYSYDYKSELATASNKNSIIYFTRDTRNRIVQLITNGQGELADFPTISMANNYDYNGNRISLLATGIGTINYSYDSLNRLNTLQNSWGDSFNFGYNNVGFLSIINRPGSQTNYSYSGNKLLSLIHSSGGNTKSFSEYTYDERNYPLTKRSPAGSFTYSYDSNGQLLGSSGNGILESYSYDSLGNRIQDQAGSYSYDNKTQQLNEDWQYIYSYDANGNLIQKLPKDPTKNAFVYSYSSKNQLVQIQIFDKPLGQINKEIKYYYDVLGRRIQKIVLDKLNPVDPAKSFVRRFIYDNENILAEFNGTNELLARYTYSPLRADDILAADITSTGSNSGMAQISGKYYYLKDALGSVTDIINGNGEIVQRYDYDSFGKIKTIKDISGVDITSMPTVDTSFAFTGREYDRESGAYYYRARYYDPIIGRFLQRDPKPGYLKEPSSVINQYVYVQNKPNILTDSTGKDFLSDIGDTIGGGFNSIVNAGHDLIGGIGREWDNMIKSSWFKDAVFLAVVAGTAIEFPGLALGVAISSGIQMSQNGDWSFDNFRNHFYNNLVWGIILGVGINAASGAPLMSGFTSGFGSAAVKAGISSGIKTGIAGLYLNDEGFNSSVNNSIRSVITVISNPKPEF